MIGVAVSPAEKSAAREFFELCKVPWSFVDDPIEHPHEILVTTLRPPRNSTYSLIVAYGSDALELGAGNPTIALQSGAMLQHARRSLPIYGQITFFADDALCPLREHGTGRAALQAQRQEEATFVRLGYNLFEEVRRLLTDGQPAENAAIPTLDLHICLLRDLIVRAGQPFIEIPPVPAGYAFIACLTHDVDHPILRNHRFDPAMFGFLYRATIGTWVDVCRGKRPLRSIARNLLAAASLPLVYLGLSSDPWRGFDRYLEIERNLGSTFFVIPRAGYPGRKRDGVAPPLRACRYELADIASQFKNIVAAGGEVGLHGIDAWLDQTAAASERAQIVTFSGESEIGVRMHWLYFDKNSPTILDRMGFTYDSTFGYNETVGFKAGTSQVFRPLGVPKLLELPLNVMDTALFYPAYLNLGFNDAKSRVRSLVEDVAGFGGTLTVNWHDRSIAPERLWEEFYREMVGDFVERRAWLPTASGAVGWFRKRRTATLHAKRVQPNQLRLHASLPETDATPDLLVRVYLPSTRGEQEPLSTAPTGEVRVFQLNNGRIIDTTITL